MSKWSDIKMYDLSIPIGILTPPWPTYEPMQVKFFKRLAPNGANGQLVTHSNHVGTHLDGPLHFDTAGRDIASLELTKLCAPGVVVDLSDMAQDFGIYTPKDLMDRAEIRKGDILIIKPIKPISISFERSHRHNELQQKDRKRHRRGRQESPAPL